MAVQIQLRRDLAAQWTSVNPILADGEWGYEQDTGKFKVGNGLSAWSSVDYALGDLTSMQAQISALSAAHTSLVDRVSANSAAGGGGSVTSAEVQVASAAATSADNHANTVSARVVSVSAELASLVQIASAAATSADGHAATASLAATSADGHANTVSARAVSISAELASLVQIASAAATSADGHANTASAAATSVNNRVNSVNSFISGISSRSVGNVSTHGLQSVINALSGRIAAVGGGSVTSAELDAVSNAVSVETAARIVGDDALSAKIDTVSDRLSTLSTNYTSLVNRVSANSAAGGGGSVTSTELSAVSAQALSALAVELADRVSADAVLQNRISTLSGTVSTHASALASVNTALSAVSANSATSVKGLQPVIDLLSARIAAAGGGGSVTSAEVQVASAAATSADAHANTVSARVVSVSAELASLLASTSATLNNAINSEQSNRISADAALFAGIHEVSTSVNAVSLRLISVSAEVVSLLASASATLETHIVAASAAATSVLNLHNTLSAGLGAPQFKRVTGAQAIATATFTKVSGLSLSIEGSGFYEVHGQLVWSQSGGGSASAIFNFGMSMTAQPVMAMFRMQGNSQNLIASATAQHTQFGGNSAICATPSIMYSVKISAVSGSVVGTMFFDGVLAASTVGSQLKVVAACSTGAFGINIQPGSYVRAYKIG